jgi:hypothetical protein
MLKRSFVSRNYKFHNPSLSRAGTREIARDLVRTELVISVFLKVHKADLRHVVLYSVIIIN